ncbi:hypothetical protein K6V43_10625 [Streptococcus suis]|nr:hypothetical protein [Streptococcus suis]
MKKMKHACELQDVKNQFTFLTSSILANLCLIYLPYKLGVLSYFILLVIIIIFCKILIKIYESFKNNIIKLPFTYSIGIMSCIFITMPLLISILGSKSSLSEIAKTFYSVAVGIGVNYILDSVFKIIESDTSSEEKKYITKYASISKIIFNSFYIAEYSVLLFISPFLDLEKQLNLKDFFKIIGLTIVFFLFIIILVYILGKLIKKELDRNKESKNEQSIENARLTVETVSQYNDSNEKIDQEIQSDLVDMEEK